jgi:hypothetical protein
VRLSLVLLSCLCTAGCGGCVDDNTPPGQEAPRPGQPSLNASVTPRSTPLPLRGIQFLLLDAGARD